MLLSSRFLVLAAVLVGLLGGIASRVDAIVITEIMYHPSAAAEASVGGRSLEWIEIYNEEPTPENLSGWFFSNGVFFEFPYDTYLPGRSYLVICADEQAVRDAYGITNTIGNFELVLDNNGETIELEIFGGGTIERVSYSDRNQWPQSADGAGHSLVLRDVFLDSDDNDSWTASPQPGGTPGGPNFDEPTIVETVIVDDDEVWRYRKGNMPFPAGWLGLGFDDSGWVEGRTGIGYGDGDDRTELTDMSGNYWSFAARKTFQLTAEQLAGIENLVFEVNYDDGFVAHLNGVEFARGALGAEGTPVSHTQAAELHEANGMESFTVPVGELRVGENVIAVQINNNTLGSSDASFVPRLVQQRIILPDAAGPPVPIVISECHYRTDGERWIELRNTGASSFDLSGYYLSDDRNALDRFEIPAGTTIGAGGYLVLTEAETGLRFTDGDLAFYLSRPGLDQVVDARVFEAPALGDGTLEGLSEARDDAGGRPRFWATEPTPGAANTFALVDSIVINEIMYAPPSDRAEQEFIEFYNRGASAVDVSGFRINRGVEYTFPDGTVLAPGDHVVVAADPGALKAAHGIAGVHGPYEGRLADGGELIRVVDVLGNIVDEVRYFDDGRWSHWANGRGSSLELIDASQDNSVASAWEASDESGKSEWEELEYSLPYSRQNESEFHIRMLGRAEVLIDAISLSRGGTSYVANGGFESSTSGWRIEGNHIQSHRITSDRFEGNACLKIVATGDGDTRVNRIERETSPAMSSGTYTVRVALKWLRGTNLIYFSGYRQGPEFQRTHWITRPAALGTPGARNSQALDNIGPVISDVAHSPAMPAPSQTVEVTARVSDSDGVSSVFARYSLGSPGGAVSSVRLFDDGAHGDGRAGDGLFGGTIPGQSNNVKVVYWIEGEDDTGETRRFPREERGKTLVYQHGSLLTARGFTARLIHDDATWSELNSRRLHSNELLDATFIFNEEQTFYNVGTRYRGSPWNRPGNPRMYRVRFPQDDPWRERRSVNLSRYGSAQNDHAAYYSVWRNSTPSTPSPKSRSSFTRFRTQAGTWTMELQEPVARDYLNLWFPGDADGNLMKITGKQTFDDSGNHQSGLLQWARYGNLGSNKASYRWNWNPRTNEEADDFAPLIAIMQKMSGSIAALDAELEDIMDVEQFLRVYAARCAHDDWDTIAIGNGQNAYVYYASVEGRWKLLPWDMDHSWSNTGARIYPDADGTFSRIISRPRFRRIYLGILNEMINGRSGRPGHWSTNEMVAKYLDEVSAAVGADGVGGAGGIRNFINARRGGLSSQLPSRIAFTITTNGGSGFSVNEVSARIEGNAWVDVHSIQVNGATMPTLWTTTTRWRIDDVPLDAGENVVDVIALDSEGDIVGSDSILVTSTAGWAAPTITDISPAEALPGDTVTITGTEFHDGIEVAFDGVPGLAVVFDESVDPTSLSVEVPLIAPGDIGVVVTNVDGRSSSPETFTVGTLPPQFVRGDVNIDELVDLSDAVRLLGYLFRGLEMTCADAGDVNNDEALEVTDAILVLEYLFLQGAPPSTPYPEKGYDEGDDPLDCREALDPLS